MEPLTGDQRNQLWELGDSLRPVDIPAAGVGDEERQALEASLAEHGLAKLKLFRGTKEAREKLLHELVEQLGGQLVRHVGHVAIVYRPRPPVA